MCRERRVSPRTTGQSRYEIQNRGELAAEEQSKPEPANGLPLGVSGFPPAGSRPKRILVADDHEVTRHGVISLLASQPDIEVCGEAEDGLEAVAKTMELKPDLVLLDLTMPRVGGFAAAHKIQEAGLAPKILILTTHSYPTLEENIRSAHCHGYVLKGSAGRDLIRGIRAVLCGDKFYNSEVARAHSA